MSEFPLWPNTIVIVAQWWTVCVWVGGVVLLLLWHNSVSYLQLEGENLQLLVKSHSQRTIPHQSISPPSRSRPSLPFGCHICSVLLLLAFISRQQKFYATLFSPYWHSDEMAWPKMTCNRFPLARAATQHAAFRRHDVPCLTTTHQQRNTSTSAVSCTLFLSLSHTHTSYPQTFYSIFNLGWLRNRPNFKQSKIKSVCYCLYLDAKLPCQSWLGCSCKRASGSL